MSTYESNHWSALEREYELEAALQVEEPEPSTEREDPSDDPSSMSLESELEALIEDEREGAFDDEEDRYARRFYELTQREYESGREFEAAVAEVIDDLEREYFFGSLKKALGRGARALAKRAISVAGRHVPVLQAVRGITSLARGKLKGMLGPLASATLSALVPGGAVLGPALASLGRGLVSGRAPSAGDLRGLVNVAKGAFEHLAHELTEHADQPAEAVRLAASAMQQALRGSRGPARRTAEVHRLRVARGDKIEIVVV